MCAITSAAFQPSHGEVRAQSSATGRANVTWIRKAVDPPPVLLWYEGELMTSALRKHQLTEADVHTAARESGHGSLDGLRAVIMQQDGSLGVIADGSMGDGSTVLPYVTEHPGR